MNAEIISVGTELLLGQIVNTNAKYLSEKMAEIGVDVYYHTTVGDNKERFKKALQIAEKRADLVITTGGLGPTSDDITKEVVAEYLDLPLLVSEDDVSRFKRYLEERNREWVESNLRQFMYAKGTEILKNDLGFALGMAAKKDDSSYILLPGPPGEMKCMFERYAIPWINKNLLGHTKITLFSRVLRFTGIPESKLEYDLKDLFDEQQDPTLALLIKPGEITLRLSAKAKKQEDFNAKIEPLLSKIESRVGKYLVKEDEGPLLEILAKRLTKQKITLSTAESCTGGMVSGHFTSIPGSSHFYLGSIIAYSNELKKSLLGIPSEMLDDYGAVSKQVASAMAENVRRVTGSSLGIAVTGIAGPDGATAKKEVGLVYIALNAPGFAVTQKFNFTGDRENVRMSCVNSVQHILWQYLKKAPKIGSTNIYNEGANNEHRI